MTFEAATKKLSGKFSQLVFVIIFSVIKISKASKNTTKDWSEEEWHNVDLAHYGRRVEWNDHKFRFKATENGKILGLISGDVESGILYIGAIITTESARGKGIGTMLMKRVEEFGKKHGTHRIWLVTGKDWSENAFYKKLGFKLEGVLPDFHFHKDFVIYTKRIN